MPQWDDIRKSLEDKKYKWRTVRGVAKEVGADEEEVRRILGENSSEVIKSSIQAETGEDLFTTRAHYRKQQSPFVKIASSLSGRVSSSSSSSSED